MDEHFPLEKTDRLVFDSYPVPVTIEQDNLNISLKKQDGLLAYYRECGREVVEKSLLADRGQLYLNPVEPINKPKELTPFFLVMLEQPLAVRPRENREITVTFPVEIASIFVGQGKSYTVLDVFSLVSPKYTLYGSPATGMLCRYWQSRVYAEPPETTFYLQGTMQVRVQNTTARWAEVTRMVFNAQDMKLFYDRHQVSMKGYMKILSDTTAETGFIEEHPKPAESIAKKSMDLFTSGKLLMAGPKMLMEEGI